MRNRTADLLITNQLLYQLSYTSDPPRLLREEEIIRQRPPGPAP